MKLLSLICILSVSISGILPAMSHAAEPRELLQNKGSDTMVAAVTTWSEAYKRVNPKAGVAVTAGGSGTGIAALINGTVDIANASRAMREKELDMANKLGRNPVRQIVGYDGVAIYVHKNNPIEMMTFTQLAEIYGEGGKINKWSDIGVTVPGCKDQEIIRISRQNSSGTYGFLRRTLLGKERDYKMGSRDMQASKDTVALVGATPCAIGYSSQVYTTDQVSMVCIAKKQGDSCIKPSIKTVLDQSYPFSRPLYMYTDGEPSGEIKKYIDWVLSNEGQCLLQRRGYAPLRRNVCDNVDLARFGVVE